MIESVVILAAGRGSRLGDLTTEPKPLLRIGGRSLLSRHLEHFAALGAGEAVVVVGYEAEQVRAHVGAAPPLPVRYVVNADYAALGNAYSLMLGLDACRGACLALDGDLIYDREIARRFCARSAEGPPGNRVLVGPGELGDIECTKTLVDGRGFVTKLVDKRLVGPGDEGRFLGEAVGMLLFSGEGRRALLRCAAEFFRAPENLPLNWEHLMNRYVREQEVRACYEPSDRWIEIDTPEDAAAARARFEP